MECAAIGFAANLMQLTGLNPIQLISMIWNSAQYANVHKRNCIQFAENLQRIGNLLEPIKDSPYLKSEAMQEPLTKLKEQLFFGFIMVDNCKNKSKFVVFAFSWWKQIPKKFQDMETEIRELILTCVTLINANLQINAHSDLASKLSMIHAEVCKIRKGTYKESSRDQEIQAMVSGTESGTFQRQHARLQAGYDREKQRLDKMLRRRGPTAAPTPSTKVEIPPNQNPLTENWHMYALKYSNQYRQRHSQQLCQATSSGPSHLEHSHSLPPRAAPRQYFHNLSMHETTSRGLGALTGPTANWQPRSIPAEEPDLSDSMLSEVYCAVGYSYTSNK